MARGDSWILQNAHDGFPGGTSVAIRPADGVEVLITSILHGAGQYIALTIPSPSNDGSSNFTYIGRWEASNNVDIGWKNCKVFVRYATYIHIVGISLLDSNDRADYHISGVVTKQ